MQRCRTLLLNGKAKAVGHAVRVYKAYIDNGISTRLLPQLLYSPLLSFSLLILPNPLSSPPHCPCVPCCASLGLLVRKVRDSHVLSIVSTLSKNIFLDKEELRDISGIGERQQGMCVDTRVCT